MNPSALPMRCIGLMSGTSLDGVDGVLCSWDEAGRWQGVQAHVAEPFEPAFREQLMALQCSGPDELHRAALAGNALSRRYAMVVAHLLAETGIDPLDVDVIGAHGQTVRHQPLAFDGVGYTVQIGNPSLLAELSGIDVIADFRSRDLAAGGQGAPLVPPFHQAMFADPQAIRAVVNIGGISNLTWLAPGEAPRGWDVGPGNVLMDGWIARHRGLPYDADGAWAASGQIIPALLDALLAEPFLALPSPKSTGRDLFDAAWLDAALASVGGDAWEQADVQATLCAYTALAITRSIDDQGRAGAGVADLLVCGGGTLNGQLMRQLQMALPGVQVQSTEPLGLPPLQVEAAAFAWLARCHRIGIPASEPAVTGARGARVLGACHPAD